MLTSPNTSIVNIKTPFGSPAKRYGSRRFWQIHSGGETEGNGGRGVKHDESTAISQCIGVCSSCVLTTAPPGCCSPLWWLPPRAPSAPPPPLPPPRLLPLRVSTARPDRSCASAASAASPASSSAAPPGAASAGCTGSAARTAPWRTRTAPRRERSGPRCANAPFRWCQHWLHVCCWSAWRPGWSAGRTSAQIGTASCVGTPSGRRTPCCAGWSWRWRAAGGLAPARSWRTCCSSPPGWGQPACGPACCWQG